MNGQQFNLYATQDAYNYYVQLSKQALTSGYTTYITHIYRHLQHWKFEVFSLGQHCKLLP